MAKSPCRRRELHEHRHAIVLLLRDEHLDQQLVGFARGFIETKEELFSRQLLAGHACFARPRCAPSARMQAGSSADGSASAMLPPNVPRLRTATWATCGMASAISGSVEQQSRELITSTCRASAPMRTHAVASRDAFERLDAIDVDQKLGLRQSHVEHRHEALPAGKDARVVAMLGQQLQRVIEALRPHITESRSLHAPLLSILSGDALGVRAPPLWD